MAVRALLNKSTTGPLPCTVISTARELNTNYILIEWKHHGKEILRHYGNSGVHCCSWLLVHLIINHGPGSTGYFFGSSRVITPMHQLGLVSCPHSDCVATMQTITHEMEACPTQHVEGRLQFNLAWYRAYPLFTEPGRWAQTSPYVRRRNRAAKFKSICLKSQIARLPAK